MPLESTKYEIKFPEQCDYIVISGFKEEDSILLEIIYLGKCTVFKKAT